MSINVDQLGPVIHILLDTNVAFDIIGNNMFFSLLKGIFVQVCIVDFENDSRLNREPVKRF